MPETAEPILTLNELLESVGNPKWDLTIICDGSGQGWAHSIGWAAVTIDRKSGKRDVIIGGASSGTVNLAEIEPVVYAIRKDFSLHDYKLKELRNVIVFSDSEVTCRTGNGEYRSATNNPDLWMSLEFFRSQGYRVSFFHKKRNENPMHVAVDVASKQGHSLGVGADWLGNDLYEILPYRATGYATPNPGGAGPFQPTPAHSG